MAARFQFGAGFRRDAALQMHDAHIGFTGIAIKIIRRLAAANMFPTRGIARLLKPHVEIDEVQDDLHMALRLHAAAHQAEAQPGFERAGLFDWHGPHLAARHVLLEGESRDDRMEGPLAGLEDVWMGRVEAEQLAPVLEHETEAIRDEPRAHAAIVRLDKGHHHAVLVRNG